MSVGTQKFVDLGAFPVDPDDHEALREGVTSNDIVIYLRLFDEHGFVRRIVVMNTVETLLAAWNISNLIEPATDVLAGDLMDKVFQTFSQSQPTSSDEAIASTAMQVLCLYYIPNLRQLKTVPAENIIGIILEYDHQRLKEYCYFQFSLDTPERNVH